MFAALLFNQPLTLKLVTTMHKLLPVIGLFCMLLLSLHGQAQSSWADSTLNTMSLDEINDAFDLMHEGKSIRTVIRY